MKQAERDIDQLHVILRYCDRLDAAIERFGNSFETFEHDTVYQDSCALSIIQIGEAVHRLSDDFAQAHPEIEWSRIYGMRCHLVHGYEMFDAEIVWDAIETCIPPLRAFCEQTTASKE
ncbi:MAG: DUF86 domain-containing protein [Eggerthellaceae bacterium]|nr:DUF86 domain-containing protein [Eggerthellaceae bacterium]